MDGDMLIDVNVTNTEDPINTSINNKPNTLLVCNSVLDLLDFKTKRWVTSLSSQELAYVFQAVNSIPNVIHSLKYTPPYIPPYASPYTSLSNQSASNQSVSNQSSYFNGVESNAAADIGKRGENEFAKICNSLPDNYKLINTSKQGKQGDFVIIYKTNGITKKCLVDLKKYASTIPKKEIDKFYDDINFGHYDAGLIISYNSRFVGIPDDIYMENRATPYATIPIMFLSNTNNLLILQAIKILMLKTIVSVEHSFDISKLESMLEFINNSMMQSSLTRRCLSDLQTGINTQIQKCQENLTSLEVQIRHTIKEMEKLISHATGAQITNPTKHQTTTNTQVANTQVINTTPTQTTTNTQVANIKPVNTQAVKQLNTKPTAKHQLFDPSVIPKISARDDNLDDGRINILQKTTQTQNPTQTQNSYNTSPPIVTNPHFVLDESNADNDDKSNADKNNKLTIDPSNNSISSVLICDNINKFRLNDRSLIRQIYELQWESVENNVFEHSNIIVELEALKTKTKVKVFSPDGLECKLFEKKGKYYIATLTNEVYTFIRDFLSELSNYVDDDHIDDDSDKSDAIPENDEVPENDAAFEND